MFKSIPSAVHHLARTIWLIPVVLSVVGTSLAQEPKPMPDSAKSATHTGKFLAFLKGQPVGTETFSVSDNELTGEVSLKIGVQIQARTHIRYEGQKLALFEVEQNNAKLSADVSSDPIKLVGPTGTKEVKLPAGTIVLESVFMHHYHTLVSRYDQKAGGKQTFQALVPTLAVVVPITLELKEKTETSAFGQPISLWRFSAQTGPLVINLVTNDALDLLMVDVPAQTYTAVREGYESLRPKAEPALANDKYENLEVEIPSTEVRLAGTLTLPKNGAKRHPAVVLITGSGPQDRDEDTPPLLNTHLYRLIADRLSSAGIAVLRCDDRGVAKSTGDFSAATLNDFVADAQAQVKFLKARPDIDPARVSVLGHSEGGYIAPMVAEADPKIHAVVILAGPSRPLDVLMEEQVKYQAEFQDLPEAARTTAKSLIEPIHKMIAEVKADRPTVDKDGKKVAQLGRVQWNFEWLHQHFAHDPMATIKKVKCPVLILQGDRDMLVQKYHAEKLGEALAQAGNKRCTVKIFPYLTHMFTTFPYNNPDPQASSKADVVSEDFLSTLREWGAKNF